jgi:hypothetical protein
MGVTHCGSHGVEKYGLRDRSRHFKTDPTETAKVGELRDSHNLTLTFIFEWHLAPASKVTGELTLPFKNRQTMPFLKL